MKCDDCPLETVSCRGEANNRWCVLKDDPLYLPRLPKREGGLTRLFDPNRAVIRSFLNNYSGFGRFVVWIGRGLEEAGVPVVYDSLAIDEAMSPISEWQRSRISDQDPHPWRLLAHYLGYPVQENKKTIYYSMHETTRVKPEQAVEFNKSVAMIVPAESSKKAFKDSGVTVPIRVVRCGIAEEEGFRFEEGKGGTRIHGTFRVLFAGMLQAGGVRKGVRDAIDAFRLAFRNGEDVSLTLKLWTTCLDHIGPIPNDPRITILTDSMETHELADLYRESSVLLAPTRGEGIGLHTLEAAKCGVPAIIPLASGTADYLDSSTCFPVKYDWKPISSETAANGEWKPPDPYYTNMGEWHVPRMGSLVQSLRNAYFNRERVASTGRRAARRMDSLTWKRNGEGIREVMEEFGMLRKRSL